MKYERRVEWIEDKTKLSSVEVMNFLSTILLNKIAKVFLYLACNSQPQLTLKNLAIHLYEWWNIMNWYLSQFLIYHLHAILSLSLSPSFISSRLHAMSWTICRIYFSFFSLHHSNDENVSHFYCCTNRHLFLQYMRSSATKKTSFRIDDVNLLHHRQSCCWMLMVEMECQWLNLLISEQFVIFLMSHFRWISSAKCAVNLPRAFILAHLPAKDARWERLMNLIAKCTRCIVGENKNPISKLKEFAVCDSSSPLWPLTVMPLCSACSIVVAAWHRVCVIRKFMLIVTSDSSSKQYCALCFINRIFTTFQLLPSPSSMRRISCLSFPHNIVAVDVIAKAGRHLWDKRQYGI